MFQRLMNVNFLLVICLSSLLLTACDKPAPDTEKQQKAKTAIPAPALQQVQVVVAEKRIIQPSFEYPAVIEALESASMRAQIAAAIVERNITPGAMVKKGDLLIKLDDSQYQAKLAEAKANLLEASATAKQAQANWKRAQQLKPKGYISDQDYDLARAKASSSQAKIAQFGAALQRAELDLEHTNIYAPFSGKISAANFSVGDFVMPNNPVQPLPLFELVKLDPIYAIAHVSLNVYDNFILKRMELKSQGIEIPPLELRIKLPGGQDYPYTGVFENWDHSAAADKGAIAGRMLFDNPDGLLLPGHNVTLHGRLIDKLERIVIPQKAVAQDQQGHYVMAVDPEGLVSRKNITVGIRDGKDWAVRDGIEEGAQIIVEGLQKVRPGDKVKVSTLTQ